MSKEKPNYLKDQRGIKAPKGGELKDQDVAPRFTKPKNEPENREPENVSVHEEDEPVE
jgi:hypothetical protein